MRELYPYQERGLTKLLEHTEGGALLYEPGLGKTITAIRAAEAQGIGRILIVCPVVAIGVWRQELEAEGYGDEILIPEGTRKEKAQQILKLQWHNQWVIVNYEALLDPDLEHALRSWGAGVVILDEAHKIKTPTAKRSKAVHRLTKDRLTWLLTGTPVTRNLLDLYSLYKAIDPGIWLDESWTKFKQRHAIFGGFEGREVVGIRDPDALLKQIEPYSVSARKQDVLDLPKRRDQVVPIYLTGADWSNYRELAQTGVLKRFDIVTDNPLTKALRLQQLVGQFKLPYTIERIQELLDAGKKVVVFYRFRAEGHALWDAADVGRRYLIDGSVPAKVREDLVCKFQNLEGPAVLLGQIQAASTAITLTAAHEVVYHSLTFAYEDLVQSRDRVYRIGQTQPVRYQYIVARGPQGGKLIDDMIVEALQNKQDIASLVVAHPEILEVADEYRVPA